MLSPAEKAAVLELSEAKIAPRRIAAILGLHVNQVLVLTDVDYLARCRENARRAGIDRAVKALRQAQGRLHGTAGGHGSPHGELVEPRAGLGAPHGELVEPRTGITASGIEFTSRRVDVGLIVRRRCWLSLPRVRFLEKPASPGAAPPRVSKFEGWG